MTLDKELLAPKEMTSQELKVLVDEWKAAGGIVKQCKPSVALNYAFMREGSELPKMKIQPGRRMGKPKKKS